MKNIKNMASAAGLMAVLVFGAISANAGLVKGDETADTTNVQCTANSEGFADKLAGFINGLTGIAVFDVTPPACSEPVYNRVRWS